MEYQFDLVGKIGSMALIRKEDQEIDYNIISRLGADLKPGMIWVTSGATEIGRLDYIKRTGHELSAELPAVPPAGIRPAPDPGRAYPFQRPGKAGAYQTAADPRGKAEDHPDHQLQRPGIRR